MPLILETGEGFENADTWFTLGDADAFFADRNIERWGAASVTAREGALRNAADYLAYAYRWAGQPTNPQQRLPWPRRGVRSALSFFPSNAIPSQIVDAQLQLALDALGADIMRRDPAAERQLIEETKAAKGMSKTLRYATMPIDPVSGMRRFPVVDNILRGIALNSMGGEFAVVPLVRGR